MRCTLFRGAAVAAWLVSCDPGGGEQDSVVQAWRAADAPSQSRALSPATDHAGSSASSLLAPETFADLLIQDVCAASDGRLYASDPYDPCQAGSERRDLRVGEALPYHRHDQPGPGAPIGYQRHDSFPRPGPGPRFVHSFDFAPFGEYNPDRDGYDVVEADGSYAAIIGTRDPVGLAQTFFGPGCALDDGWLLFPKTGYASGGERLAQLVLVGWERAASSYPGRCPGRYDRSLTRFGQRTVSFGEVYGSREKTLPALVVDHYGGDRVATADHIERFYFTRLYGLTRWERWGRTGVPRREGCNGAVSEAGFVRVDCRDWTHIVPDPTPYPSEAWPTPYADANLVRNHDFGDGSARYWERIGTSRSGAITNLSIVPDGSGHHLATNCAGSCSPGQAVFQDVRRAGLGGTFRFGARLWADGGSGSVEFVVFQRDARATILARHSVPLVVDGTPRRVVSPSFAVLPGTDQLRITLYLNAPNTFHADDFFLARAQP